jgi:hypothetical protein
MRGLQKVFLWVRALLNGSEMDHFLPGGVCEEVTEWLAIVGCAKVFRGNLAVAPAG